mmetsp:Transcript_5748/g.16130  ORF Transcript_5748/g.16130 Transcript_5748/m.16130 type:complete len:98 (-) Transcript_5748:168-461(-)
MPESFDTKKIIRKHPASWRSVTTNKGGRGLRKELSDSGNDSLMSVQRMFLSVAQRSATKAVKKLVTKVAEVKSSAAIKKGPKGRLQVVDCIANQTDS